MNAARCKPRVTLAAVDGVRLAGAGLAVRKDAHVVAVHCRLHQVPCVLKYLRKKTRLQSQCILYRDDIRSAIVEIYHVRTNQYCSELSSTESP